MKINYTYLLLCILAFLVYLFSVVLVINCESQELTASWYSIESCHAEGTSGIMANGEVYNDRELVCASWDYTFGTELLITNTRNNKTVRVVVKDRGPNRNLYRRGRVIDLSKQAFSQIARLEQGVIPITIREG